MNESRPPLASGEGVRALIALMDTLRSPGGCPWDAEQTHESLLEYLLEEAYETVDAVHAGDRASLREELGDVLLQVVFHARIAQEHATDPFDVDDVARGIVEKLTRRHPHVFGDAQPPAVHEAQERWEELKALEKQRASVTDGVPDSMPASLLAVKLLGRARRKDVTAAVSAVVDDNAAQAVQQLLAESLGAPDVQAHVGELLLGLIAAATTVGIDTEKALRHAVRDYRARVRAAEGVSPGQTQI